MAHRHTVVVAGSAGALEPLRAMVAGLPPDFPAAVLVVVHVSSSASALPAILARTSALPVTWASDGAHAVPGHVYVAPAGHHLLLIDDHLVLTRGPRENGHRPAADPMFRSAAVARGPRVVGVVLSGALDDGAAGLAAVRQRGGVGVVQDPEEALHDSMPRAALRTGGAEHIAPGAELAALLQALCAEEVDEKAWSGEGEPDAPAELLSLENRIAALNAGVLERNEPPGTPAGLSCPDCNGTLYEVEADASIVRYRCRVGHAWSPESLLAQQGLELESALWIALRTLEDKAALNRRMAQDSEARGRMLTATRFGEAAEESSHAAELVRRLLVRGAEGSLGAAG